MKDEISLLITIAVIVVVVTILLCAFLIWIILKSSRARNEKMAEEIELLNQKNELTQHLFDMTRQLSRHQRLETMGVIASNMNHEFSNLLTPIMGYSLLAIEKVPDNCDELLSDLEKVYESALRAKDLVNGFKKMSRKSSDSEYTCFSPDKMMVTVEALLQPSCPSNVTITSDYDCPEDCLCANETQISQAVMNIVINAFHALSPNGGNVHITTRIVENNVEISIVDNGPGISKEDMNHIREPFFTTKSENEGTGLGIPIVEQILEMYRGELLIESEVGKGSTFTIRIPAKK